MLCSCGLCKAARRLREFTASWIVDRPIVFAWRQVLPPAGPGAAEKARAKSLAFRVPCRGEVRNCRQQGTRGDIAAAASITMAAGVVQHTFSLSSHFLPIACARSRGALLSSGLARVFTGSPSGCLGLRGMSGGNVSGRVSMTLRGGIVGLPNVGKSTLFNALVENGKAQAANFPFCTIEPNVGIVAVPDPRLEILAKLGKSQKIVPASVEFVDIAGLVKGASQGEGLGNKFLSHIREVDSIVQVVRCFEDDDIVHVSGKVDPASDIEVINLELAFSDMAQIEKRLERLKKGRVKDPQVKAQEELEAAALQRINDALLSGIPARAVALTDDEKKMVDQLCLLTMKPVIFAANVAEADLADSSANSHVQQVRQVASSLNADVVVVSAQVEAELTELDPEERTDYLQSLGVDQGGLTSLVRSTYSLLGLRTYFTCGEKETRAWTILAGMTAPQAAGVIHSDFERGFIRAETVAYDDFVTAGSLAVAREKDRASFLKVAMSREKTNCLFTGA
ncbi:hypothetical protein AXG93_374s1080 [Marchantia polymorpha subsp. ruderalis]|uniref:Obg-like ATPase 1 n=1 Tax=Marchantia polymorpha subsp. ruderalis TaxID=1480154 RepID=A0A176WJJ0_MARPO|nr:hypothetical protein AXG93_374s1080 [Marchantia polymorpha subsp. ruderalis]